MISGLLGEYTNKPFAFRSVERQRQSVDVEAHEVMFKVLKLQLPKNPLTEF